MRHLVGPVSLVVVLAGCAEQPHVEPSEPPFTTVTDAGESDVLELTCDGETTTILTPEVRAQADGVHVLIHNTGDAEVLTQWEGGGDGAEPGDSTQLIPMPPGDRGFRCLSNTPDVDPGAPGGWGRFDVLPAEGWVSPGLDCETGKSSIGFIDYVEGATGTRDPLAEVQAKAKEKEGEVMQAGYVTESSRAYIVFVDGRTTERFEYFSDRQGGWLMNERAACTH